MTEIDEQILDRGRKVLMGIEFAGGDGFARFGGVFFIEVFRHDGLQKCERPAKRAGRLVAG